MSGTHRPIRSLLAHVLLLLAILAHVEVVDDIEEVLHDRHFLEADSVVAFGILSQKTERILEASEKMEAREGPTILK